ncbi:hypothetical protein QN277_000091 [Acacia crassicarpa]|uniref:Low-temperature-induced 65 kDa protein n=1 Tax=Acacia crassicarpa TaxID=499986 RepID=A0AAE1TGS0_9FABA|nr:hypothetical protein QN277_000091 [Acacia crassicarpa]
MDSGIVHSRVHESDQHHPHNVGLKQAEDYGADEHPQDREKKSVLKKVKAKAKKIKDTIKKHAHHDHDHDREHHDIPDDHDLDEEDDEDEDMDENPEVHGAPIYDSTVPRTVIPGEQVVVHHQEPKVVVVSPGIGNDQKVANDSATRTFTAEEGNTRQQKVNLQKPLDLEEDPAAPGSGHPHTASNHQSKVTDPTGTGVAEIQVTPVLKSFAQMNVHDGAKPYPEPHVRSTATQYPSGTPIPYEEQKHYESMDKPSIQSSYTATQSPSGTPIVHEEQKHYSSLDKPPTESSYTATQPPSGAPIVHEEQKLYEPVDKPMKQSGYMTTQYPTGISEMEIDQNRYESLDKPSNQTSYTDKVSSATSAIADKAVTAKNAVGSKLGYDDNKDNRDHENEQSRGENQSSYTDKISSATSAVADKAVSAKNAVTSKLGNGDNRSDMDNEKEGRSGENQTSYTEKISSAPSAIADKAVFAKNVVASKLGYGDNKVETDHEEEASHGENQTNSYTDKIAHATSAIADKAVSAKNAVTSKLGYGENRADRDNEKEGRPGENQTSYTEKISSAPSAIADEAVGDNKDDRENEKETRQRENQSSYTEKLSYATSAIAEKAVSAKNAVTSKLGYGSGSCGDNARTTHEDHPKTADANASTAEYGKRITESLTEKLSPVYSKVAGVGSTVKSRLSPSSTNETDKGVSVKDYFVEKLRPGDEDRALFEMISEALHNRGGEGEAASAKESGGDNHEGRKMTDVISDVIHDRDERLVETEHRPLGKVTESEEVKRRLGGESESDRRYEESYENSSEKGVVGKLKDAAGSLFGTSSQEKQSSSQATGGRRL